MTAANTARGEVALRVGGETIVLACHLESLARLQAVLEEPSYPALLRRVMTCDLIAVQAALEQLAILPEGQALPRILPSELLDLTRKLMETLNPQLAEPETPGKNPASGKGSRSTRSPGINGSRMAASST